VFKPQYHKKRKKKERKEGKKKRRKEGKKERKRNILHSLVRVNLITGAMGALTSGVFMVKMWARGFGPNLP
jgi:hypothetical protein